MFKNLNTEKLCHAIATVGKENFCKYFDLYPEDVDVVMDHNLDAPLSSYLRIAIALRMQLTELLYILYDKK